MKITCIKNVIRDKLKETNSDSVTLLMMFLTKDEIKELSRWYVITLLPLGFTEFKKREGVFDEDNGQLKFF